MSSRPGLTLEAWLAEEYYASEDSPIFEYLLPIFEPYREYVEQKLLDFDEENQSWRAYNSAVFGDYFPKEVEDEATRARYGPGPPLWFITNYFSSTGRTSSTEIQQSNTPKEGKQMSNEIESTRDLNYRPISEIIRERIAKEGSPYLANDNIARHIRTNELDILQHEVESKFQEVLKSLLIDTTNDHNTQDTAKRWSKMMLFELFKGRYEQAPPVTVFPNVKQVDEMYVVGPIESRSSCAHHLVPIIGKVWVGVIPGDKLIGLSKFHRIIDHIGSRPQIQEEFTHQVADELEALTEPRGIAVVAAAEHLCCGHRGVKDAGSRMVTNVMRGDFKTNPTTREEFMRTIDLTRVRP